MISIITNGQQNTQTPKANIPASIQPSKPAVGIKILPSKGQTTAPAPVTTKQAYTPTPISNTSTFTTKSESAARNYNGQGFPAMAESTKAMPVSKYAMAQPKVDEATKNVGKTVFDYLINPALKTIQTPFIAFYNGAKYADKAENVLDFFVKSAEGMAKGFWAGLQNIPPEELQGKFDKSDLTQSITDALEANHPGAKAFLEKNYIVKAGIDAAVDALLPGGAFDAIKATTKAGKIENAATKNISILNSTKKSVPVTEVKAAEASITPLEPSIKPEGKTAQDIGETVSTPNRSVQDIPPVQSAEGNIGTAPKTPEETKLVEDFTKSLPDTEDELNKTISDLTEQLNTTTEPTKLLHINLQLFAAKEKVKTLKTSKFYDNTLKRTLTPEEYDKLNKGSFGYEPQEHPETISKAKKNLTTDYEGTKNKILTGEGEMVAEDIKAANIITQDYLDEARKTGDYSKVNEFTAGVSVRGRKAGQSIEAFKLWQDNTPEGFIKDAQSSVASAEDALKKKNPKAMQELDDETKKLVDIINQSDFTEEEKLAAVKKTLTPKTSKPTIERIANVIKKSMVDGKINENEVRDILKEKYGIPTLSGDDIKYLDEMIQEAAKYAPDSYENKMYTAKARKLVEDKMPTEFVDKFRALQRLSMIFNLKTLVTRNPLGNVLLDSVEQIRENTIGAFVDMLTSAIRGTERTTLAMPIEKARAGIEGVKKGAVEWGKDIKYKVDTNPTHGQLELGKGKVFKGKDPVSRILNFLDTWEKRALQIGDRPFYEAAYAQRIAELKRIKKTTTISEEMMADAKAYALDKVFQNDSELSKIFGRMKNASDKTSFKVVANVILPFSQTPANILDKIIEYSPAGIIKVVSELGKTKAGTFSQKKFVDVLSRTLTGSGIIALGYGMAQHGMLTGGANKDKDVANFEKSTGKNPYALKFGNHYYTYDWANPTGSLLAIGADSFLAGKSKEDLMGKVAAGTEGGLNTFFNQTMLQNITDLFSGYSPAAGLFRVAVGSTTQVTPTAAKQVATLIDPYVRETYDPNTLKQQANVLIARIPWASKSLPVKVDAMGNGIKQYQGKNNVGNVMLNPGFFTTTNPTPAQTEIMRLYDATGEKTQFPVVAPKYFTYNGQRITLTPDEYTQFQKRIADLTMNGMKISDKSRQLGFNQIINSDTYKGIKDDKNKVKLLTRIIEVARAKAQAEVLQKRGIK